MYERMQRYIEHYAGVLAQVALASFQDTLYVAALSGSNPGLPAQLQNAPSPQAQRQSGYQGNN
ncbi:hypothetical protein MBM_05378 [Drepanopeziza brunnea f. sp. 'multigermtubi' MB_m1]|uniref:Uncharacterized protein n=1 Tax=Marssonina brunnea f. sp. multigermtubi (strain MB_m1) TaxID=1072389 RepID=K1XVZ3_MARBU|nr:uncharacterized protein MBM_05378 [Drepanopeziza brunnea f. sp. 'multigermtubi' MB_m1]EKD16909.1 hypothetical protein MBM_05378 [Drepanopeziza brunnea f. sp. 'multigermtubi' MB_m1]